MGEPPLVPDAYQEWSSIQSPTVSEMLRARLYHEAFNRDGRGDPGGQPLPPSVRDGSN